MGEDRLIAMMRIIPGVLLVMVLAACGGTTSGSNSHSARPTASVKPARTYPDQAADNALCNTFTTDTQNGDTFDLGQTLQQDQGTVSPKLASDVGVVVNETGTVQQDLINQVHVAEDCALAHVGIQPH